MFERTLKIIDKNTLEKIKNTSILLVGIGGVGGYAFESLIRLGFQKITIIDHDAIEKSNLNRQIISTTENINKLKVEVAKDRAKLINPNVKIKTYPIFLNEENIDNILEENYDYILDACDTITSKILLIKKPKKKR